MKATGKTANFLPTPDQIGSLSGIALMFYALVLQHYSRLDFRACFLIAAVPIWVAQGFLFKTPPKRWAIQVGITLIIFYFGWELLFRLWN
jgi:hypothetical protein